MLFTLRLNAEGKARACHKRTMQRPSYSTVKTFSYDLVKNVQCLILCNHVGAGIAIAESDINLLKQTLTKCGKMFEMKTYPEAPNGFSNYAREIYRPARALVVHTRFSSQRHRRSAASVPRAKT